MFIVDITSKEILEEAVKNYEGTVIYVSHDRYFINRTATRILELDNRHFVNYQGNYDYYLEKQADGLRSEAITASQGAFTDVSSKDALNAASFADANANGSSAAGSVQAQAEVKLSFKEQKERKQQQQKLRTALSNCEKEIEQHETAVSDIDTQMADPATAVNSAKLNELSSRQAEHNARLEELYLKWEELSEALENF